MEGKERFSPKVAVAVCVIVSGEPLPLCVRARPCKLPCVLLLAASRCLSVCAPARAAVYCTLGATRRYVTIIIIAFVLINVPRYLDVIIASNQVFLQCVLFLVGLLGRLC